MAQPVNDICIILILNIIAHQLVLPSQHENLPPFERYKVIYFITNWRLLALFTAAISLSHHHNHLEHFTEVAHIAALDLGLAAVVFTLSSYRF